MGDKQEKHAILPVIRKRGLKQQGLFSLLHYKNLGILHVAI